MERYPIKIWFSLHPRKEYFSSFFFFWIITSFLNISLSPTHPLSLLSSSSLPFFFLFSMIPPHTHTLSGALRLSSYWVSLHWLFRKVGRVRSNWLREHCCHLLLELRYKQVCKKDNKHVTPQKSGSSVMFTTLWALFKVLRIHCLT